MEFVLSNDSLSVTVRPDLGGRIDQIVDLETGKSWLWHPSTYQGLPRNLETGASFDDNWTGGWDEMFPNDAACHFRGRELVDHGELWSRPWRVVSHSPSSIILNYTCTTVSASIEKSVFMTEKGINVRYLLENQSEQELPFLFKLHPAIAIEPGDQILLPPCFIEPVDTGFSTIIGRSARTTFPYAVGRDGKDVHVGMIPGADALEQEFVYATDLCRGWCGIRNIRTGKNFTLSFDLKHVPYVWVFASYGRWRNHYVVMIEPCTNVPYDLETAYGNGTCAVLGPFERREIGVTVRSEKAHVMSAPVSASLFDRPPMADSRLS